MFVKYNSYGEKPNDKFEHRVVLQSIEDTINLLRRINEVDSLAAKPEKKLVELMKEKSKLRSELYQL